MDSLLQMHLMAVDWLKHIRKLIMATDHKHLQIDQKTSRKDLVTNVDRQVEAYLIQQIKRHYPGHRIIGEEGSQLDQMKDLAGFVWFIDPLDGTLNFVTQGRDYGTMLALYHDGVGQLGYIYHLVDDQLYYGIKDQGAYCDGEALAPPAHRPIDQGLVAMSHLMVLANRNQEQQLVQRALGCRTLGAASLDTIRVLTGQVLAYLSSRLAPWDIAAGQVLARELDLEYRQLDGQALDLLQAQAAVVLANPCAYQEIRRLNK